MARKVYSPADARLLEYLERTERLGTSIGDSQLDEMASLDAMDTIGEASHES